MTKDESSVGKKGPHHILHINYRWCTKNGNMIRSYCLYLPLVGNRPTPLGVAPSYAHLVFERFRHYLLTGANCKSSVFRRSTYPLICTLPLLAALSPPNSSRAVAFGAYPGWIISCGQGQIRPNWPYVDSQASSPSWIPIRRTPYPRCSMIIHAQAAASTSKHSVDDWRAMIEQYQGIYIYIFIC